MRRCEKCAEEFIKLVFYGITNFAKPRFGAFEVVLEQRNELAEGHFCLSVSNGIHRYLSALVSNLVSAFAFEMGNEAGWLKCFGAPGTMVSVVLGRAKGEDFDAIEYLQWMGE